jgi:hypothetical protein
VHIGGIRHIALAGDWLIVLFCYFSDWLGIPGKLNAYSGWNPKS